MILVFTVCSNNYLAQAVILGKSLLIHNPNYTFKIGLVDKKNSQIDYSEIPFEIEEVEDIDIPDFGDRILRYDIVELNTSVKPSYFKYFFSNEDIDAIIYLDPDIQVFAPYNDLEKELELCDIIITPHFCTPLNDDKWQAEEDFLNSGLYNLGFIAIKNTKNGNNMLNWWEERLRTKAYIDFKRGLFTDQIWINFVPLFFDKVKIFSNVGYNVAYWNLHERIISVQNGNYYINEKQPLIFYHYASFRPLNPDIISTGQKRFTFEDRPDIVPLFKNYCELVFKNGYESFIKIQCQYLEIKENYEKHKLKEIKKNTPIYKRVISKIINILIRKFRLVLDYSTLLSRD